MPLVCKSSTFLTPNFKKFLFLSLHRNACMSDWRRINFFIKIVSELKKSIRVVTLRVPFENAATICSQMGGRMPSFDSEQELMNFSDQLDFEVLGKSCGTFWLPIHRSTGNGSTWKSTQEPFDSIQYLPWADGQPGSEYSHQDCVLLYLDDSRYYDTSCNYALCSLCQIEEEAIFKLKACCDMRFNACVCFIALWFWCDIGY